MKQYFLGLLGENVRLYKKKKDGADMDENAFS